jgi:hypothetical protein
VCVCVCVCVCARARTCARLRACVRARVRVCVTRRALLRTWQHSGLAPTPTHNAGLQGYPANPIDSTFEAKSPQPAVPSWPADFSRVGPAMQRRLAPTHRAPKSGPVRPGAASAHAAAEQQPRPVQRAAHAGPAGRGGQHPGWRRRRRRRRKVRTGATWPARLECPAAPATRSGGRRAGARAKVASARWVWVHACGALLAAALDAGRCAADRFTAARKEGSVGANASDAHFRSMRGAGCPCGEPATHTQSCSRGAAYVHVRVRVPARAGRLASVVRLKSQSRAVAFGDEPRALPGRARSVDRARGRDRARRLAPLPRTSRLPPLQDCHWRQPQPVRRAAASTGSARKLPCQLPARRAAGDRGKPGR